MLSTTASGRTPLHPILQDCKQDNKQFRIEVVLKVQCPAGQRAALCSASASVSSVTLGSQLRTAPLTPPWTHTGHTRSSAPSPLQERSGSPHAQIQKYGHRNLQDRKTPALHHLHRVQSTPKRDQLSSPTEDNSECSTTQNSKHVHQKELLILSSIPVFILFTPTLCTNTTQQYMFRRNTTARVHVCRAGSAYR